MTRTAADALAAARSELGYAEHPPGSNNNKFAAEAGHANRLPWCASFVSAILIRCNVIAKGASMLVASSRTMYVEAKRKGWAVSPQDAQPGDVAHNWRGLSLRQWTGHVAFVSRVIRDKRGRITHLVTIEGNGSKAGSATGGQVVEITRAVGWWRIGIWRPPYAPALTSTPPPKVLWLLADGRIVEPVGTGTPTPVRWLPTLAAVEAKLSAGWRQVSAPAGVTVTVVA